MNDVNVQKGKQGFQETSKSESSAPLSDFTHDVDEGGHWIVQDGSTGRLVRQTNTRAQAEDVAEGNPGTEVALFIKDVTQVPQEGARMARIAGTVAHAIDDEDVARVQFYATYDADEDVRGISDLRLYSIDGKDITPDDDSYYGHVDAIEEGLTQGDLETLETLMDTISVKIR